jgi:hypothetical protein
MEPRAIRLSGNAVVAVLDGMSPALLEFLVRAFFPIYDPPVKFTQLADGPVFGPRSLSDTLRH